jgi:hypothetical protein
VSGGNDVLKAVQADAVAALKSGDKERTTLLRTVAADLKKAAIDAGVDAVGGEAAVAVLRRATKTRADAADQYAKAGREDLAAKERREIGWIEAYLPKAASEDEIRSVAREVVAGLAAKGPAAMGAAMKETLGRLAGRADGKVVSKVVAEVLRG